MCSFQPSDRGLCYPVQESMCDRRIGTTGDGRAVIMTHTRGNFLDFKNSEYLSLVILFPVRESFNMKGVDLGSRKRRHTISSRPRNGPGYPWCEWRGGGPLVGILSFGT